MATTLSIRISRTDTKRIDAIAAEFGGRADVIRLALSQFLDQAERPNRSRELLHDWATELSDVDEEEVARMTAKYFSG